MMYHGLKKNNPNKLKVR
ncbi:hypothetical protein Bhyg_00713 [Pseudolycoriella hygida]|uniref:Uncharacterized protein n=1 Tax=Pseudolycoriella hygida TaxID=35572 RepID=A0A9Q0N8X2_9DIPT|nr:hypothetical protein Bhyg_00713 [Pseudolycoriella hygida]